MPLFHGKSSSHVSIRGNAAFVKDSLEQDNTRVGFDVDYDRIVFSSFFRSLQDKTQVIPFSKTSFVHTRLTHSLEVSWS